METHTRILIVEDDTRLASLMQSYLSQRGFDVQLEEQGDMAGQRISSDKPDLVILDLMLPGMDGLSICRSIRSSFHGPIMILTARDTDMDQVLGLELGADDFVKKPVDPMVLLARIRALLRRQPPPDKKPETVTTKEQITFGNLLIDKASRSAVLDEMPVTLTTNEYDLLLFLAENAGSVIGREAIFSHLRGIGYDGVDRSVDVYISRLRKKLGDVSSPPSRIKTIWGKGYLFVKDAW